jgi:hypothetical protein
MMTARQLSLVLTAISLCGMALPASVAAADAAANDGQRPMALPSIQDLTLESDFTVFMGPEVPAQIRTLALRKLWRLRGWQSDGLVTYGADYTRFEPVGQPAIADDSVAAALVPQR